MKQDIIAGKINIIIETVRVEGKGAIILTGPSSCGKGEIAGELSRILSLPPDMHLSMGKLLRMTIKKAKESESFRNELEKKFQISNNISIFDLEHNNHSVIEKAMQHRNNLKKFFPDFVSQIDWLEYCVLNGILIPDEWTIRLIDAAFSDNSSLKENIFILDGYPRTKKAAEALLNTFFNHNIPIIKVIHLSITKEEMLSRAKGRNRQDDTIESLERRFQFYIESVQPTVDYLKIRLGSERVELVDAHLPVYINGVQDVKMSIKQVANRVLQSLGIPGFMLK